MSPACISLRAANGSPLSVLGFVRLSISLGDITRRIDALVLPSLGPDEILLDNDAMSRFGAVLDWKKQRLKFSSSKATIPAVHRVNNNQSHTTSSVGQPSSVAAVHHDAVTICEIERAHKFTCSPCSYRHCIH